MQLEARDVCFGYAGRGPNILNAVSLLVETGERLAVLAPSGCGKSTLMKLLAGHERPGRGQVLLDGEPLAKKRVDGSGASPVQLICQHPEQAVNPRWKMHRVLEEAGQLRDEVLDAMGIERAWLKRYPRELSAGELQRFCVARALGPGTRFVLADEITTMLDVVTQAQVWHHLLAEAKRRGLGLVVVTHDSALAKQVCTRVVDLRAINRVG